MTTDQSAPGPSVVPDEPIQPPPPSEVPQDVPAPESDQAPEEAKPAESKPEADDAEASPEAEDDAEASRPRSGYARLKARTQAERAAAQAKIQELETQLREATYRDENQPQRPKPEQFTDFAQYEEALDRYNDARAEQAARKVAAETRKLDLEAKQAEHQSETLSDFFERWGDFEKQMPDAKQAVDSLFAQVGPLNPIARDMIAEADNGEVILYYLAKNPGLARQINSSGPLDIARKIGELEAKTTLPKAKTETKAPPIINPPKGGATPPRDIFALAKNDDIGAYIAARKAMDKKAEG